MAGFFWLNNNPWTVLKPLLPHLGGKPRVDDRSGISGILHRFREGLRWRAMPDVCGPRTTVFNQFNRWSKRGLWQKVFAALAACDNPPATAIIVSTTVRAHRSAAGAKGGEQEQARSRHFATDRDASTPCY